MPVMLNIFNQSNKCNELAVEALYGQITIKKTLLAKVVKWSRMYHWLHRRSAVSNYGEGAPLWDNERSYNKWLNKGRYLFVSAKQTMPNSYLYVIGKTSSESAY